MMESVQTDLIVILGPTASGKTRLGVQIAGLINGEIISADSRQVYRGMDIGTGKDLSEYGQVPCHLVDIREPGEDFSVFHFQRECLNAMENIRARKKMPLLVGGTGLYLESVLKGYRMVEAPVNPTLREKLSSLSHESLKEWLLSLSSATHNTTDFLVRERLVRAIEIAEYAAAHPPEPFPGISPLVFGIRWERSLLRQRITDRLKERMEAGMIEEVANLHNAGVPWERLEYFGLEYRFISRFLKGEMNRNDMIQKLNSAIHDFAKRQETWFRRMERNGIRIHWLNGEDDPLPMAADILSKSGFSCNAA